MRHLLTCTAAEVDRRHYRSLRNWPEFGCGAYLRRVARQNFLKGRGPGMMTCIQGSFLGAQAEAATEHLHTAPRNWQSNSLNIHASGASAPRKSPTTPPINSKPTDRLGCGDWTSALAISSLQKYAQTKALFATLKVVEANTGRNSLKLGSFFFSAKQGAPEKTITTKPSLPYL